MIQDMVQKLLKRYKTWIQEVPSDVRMDCINTTLPTGVMECVSPARLMADGHDRERTGECEDAK